MRATENLNNQALLSNQLSRGLCRVEPGTVQILVVADCNLSMPTVTAHVERHGAITSVSTHYRAGVRKNPHLGDAVGFPPVDTIHELNAAGDFVRVAACAFSFHEFAPGDRNRACYTAQHDTGGAGEPERLPDGG
jgi:hypothetical protein